MRFKSPNSLIAISNLEHIIELDAIAA